MNSLFNHGMPYDNPIHFTGTATNYNDFNFSNSMSLPPTYYFNSTQDWPTVLSQPLFGSSVSSFTTSPTHNNMYVCTPLNEALGQSMSIIPSTSSFGLQPSSFGSSNNALIFNVPEDVPIDQILTSLGVNVHSLRRASSASHYGYQSSSHLPFSLSFPHTKSPGRRFECREISEREYRDRHRHRHYRDTDDDYPSSHRSQHREPLSLHGLLGAWNMAKQIPPSGLRGSASTPNLNSQWNMMKNMGSMPQQDNRNNLISSQWNMARQQQQQPPSAALNNLFGARQTSPSPSGQNAAVQNFFAARQSPPPQQGSNAAAMNFLAARQTPPYQQGSNAAVQNFLAARQSPPPQQGSNAAAMNFLSARQSPPFQQGPNAAAQNFLAARQSPPFQQGPNAAGQNFLAARQFSGSSTPPFNAASQNFLAARNLPYSGNPVPNPSFANNNWNRLSQQPSPYAEAGQNWNMMRTAGAMNQSSNPPFNRPFSPNQGQWRNSSLDPARPGIGQVPAPTSFGSLLQQARSQNLGYAGVS